MIDLETGWFETVQYKNKQSHTIANLVYQTWLCIYPRPTIITYNWGNEFLGHTFNNYLIKKYYGIKFTCGFAVVIHLNLIP